LASVFASLIGLEVGWGPRPIMCIFMLPDPGRNIHHRPLTSFNRIRGWRVWIPVLAFTSCS
jgi:hypothetical protein